MQIRERGLIRRWWWQVREIRWDEMESLQWSVKAMWQHGSFIGNDLTVCAIAKLDHGERVRVPFKQRFIEDAGLDRLRELISGGIADRLRETLRETSRCQWTSRVAFTDAGLEVRTTPWFGETGTIPYSELEIDWESPGKLKLRTGDRRKVKATIRTSSRNFYPCLKLLSELTEQNSADDQNQPPERADELELASVL
jgi:hypothetical protein